MEAFYKANHIRIYNKDCRFMEELGDESVDLIATDPPYGISFMGKDWDTFNELVEPQGAYQKKKGFKKLPRQNTISMTEFFIPIWKECLRILKPGAFAFVMCSPRADVMTKQVSCLQEAGFRVNFTPIFWAMASGFPKAQNIGKAVDKRLGTYKEGKPTANARFGYNGQDKHYNHAKITREFDAQSPQAKALDGSYAGFQPKPAVEVILVAMKPLSEKTYVDQALKNRKGITWLDDCRIPYEKGDTPQGGFGAMDIGIGKPMEHQTYRKPDSIIAKNPHTHRENNRAYSEIYGEYQASKYELPAGRFPANLLVSDDVLNVESKSVGHYSYQLKKAPYEGGWKSLEDKGNLRETNHSFSRYFDLDKWWEEKIKELPASARRTFPFLVTPKASKSEKNRGCEGLPDKLPRAYRTEGNGTSDRPSKGMERFQGLPVKNTHPTVKPIKLMSYLITLGSGEGDTVVDPFIGTGATAIACQILGRKCTGYEINANYCEIAKSRLTYYCQKAMNF